MSKGEDQPIDHTDELIDDPRMRGQFTQAYDALMQGGAYRSGNTVVLSGVQTEWADSFDNQNMGEMAGPTYVGPMSPAEAANDTGFQMWLDSLLLRRKSDEAGDGPRLTTRAFRAMQREGLHSRRDLYITGYQALTQIHFLGELTIRDITTELNVDEPYQMRWRAAPDIGDIAVLSHDLGDVTSYVLTGREDLGDTVANPMDEFVGTSVQHILELENEPDSSVLGILRHQGQLSILVAAQEFAKKYEAAKAVQGNPQSQE